MEEGKRGVCCGGHGNAAQMGTEATMPENLGLEVIADPEARLQLGVVLERVAALTTAHAQILAERAALVAVQQEAVTENVAWREALVLADAAQLPFEGGMLRRLKCACWR